MGERKRFERSKIGDSAASFSKLPDEILFIIFGYLDVVSRIRLRRVKRKWDSILRNSAVWETIRITEQERLHWITAESPLEHPPWWCTHSWYKSPRGLVEILAGAGVFKHVKNLELEGDYNLADQKPHDAVYPYPYMGLFPDMTTFISASRQQKIGDFEKLEGIIVRKALVGDTWTRCLGRVALKCRLTIDNGSFVIDDYDSEESWRVEFEVEESRTFHLSGRTAWLDIHRPVVHLSQTECDDEGFEHERIPLELAEFVVRRCNAVSTEAVAQLGDTYSKLLKGQERMTIRKELQPLFEELVSTDENNENYDPDIKHWEQCKGYNFNSVDNWTKYALVYYARPRNCYKIVKSEETSDDKASDHKPEKVIEL